MTTERDDKGQDEPEVEVEELRDLDVRHDDGSEVKGGMPQTSKKMDCAGN